MSAHDQDDDYDYGSASDYDDYAPERDCEHDQYEIDVCTGRAECDSCSYSWYLSNTEIDAELDRQARYYDNMEREERRRWWHDLFAPIIRPIFRLVERFQMWRTSRTFQQSVGDDEIPF